MFKKSIPLVFLLFSLIISAQVGIGTSSPDGALDVVSTTDGILIPRVALSATNVATVITPTVSELVYNSFTSAAGPNQVVPGFYYWDGSLWVRIAAATSNSAEWSLTGNAGTDPATNYLGTSDVNDLVLRTNAIDRVHVDTDGNVGINEVAPNSKLEIVQEAATGNTIEVINNNSTNNASAVWIKNSGSNRALHVQNLLTNSNTHVARFLQFGNGTSAHGIVVEMDNATVNSATGLLISQKGLGSGEYVLMNASNSAAGIISAHQGAGDGLQIFQTGTGDGIYNLVTAGYGIVNDIRSNDIGTTTLLTTAGGVGGYVDLDVQDGTGYYVTGTDNDSSPTAGGDVYSFFTNIRTATPSSAGNVFGAALLANQSGVGHGILINHSGSQGRNAEFNINNAANTDPAISTTHSGQGSAIKAENTNNTIATAISVGDFAYTGTDVDDHIGVEGSSTPAAGWGIGVLGTGTWYGVFSQGDFGATGTKTFLADHPLDPGNKFLRHFSIESDEVLNMYRGNIELDNNGQAVVEMPEYFEIVNTNFSYQLTAIGTPQQPYVLSEIQNNKFVVAGAPNTKVSWLVMSERNDAYMQEHPEHRGAVVEKIGERKGKYITPEFYGQPVTSGLFYKDRSKNIPTTHIQMPKNTLETIEKLKKAEKKTTVHPEANSEDSEG